MTLPFAVPAWLPWWVPLVLLVLALLWGLAFLLVPFSVIGVKARLEGLEARLDEIQAEIRTLALRLPEGAVSLPFDEVYTAPQAPPARAEPELAIPRRPFPASRPPIPPAAPDLRARRDPDAPLPGSLPRPPGRVEPRLDRRS